MAVLLKRRHLGVEAVPRTSSSNRNVLDLDCSRTDHSLTPKKLPGTCFYTPTGRPTRPFPLIVAKRTLKPRSRTKEKSSKLRREETEEKLNHSFSCSQVSSKSRSRRTLQQENTSPGTDLSEIIAESGKSGLGKTVRKTRKSPETEKTARLEYARCRETLEELIRSDPRYRIVLKTVQTGYEDYILTLENAINAVSKEAKTAEIQLRTQKSTEKQLEALVSALQNKVQALKFELDFRAFEAGEQKGISQNLDQSEKAVPRDEVKTLKKQVRFCVKLLDFMKAKGLPVNETYQEMRSQRKSTRDSDRSAFLSYSDLEFEENLSTHGNFTETDAKHRKPLPEIPLIIFPKQAERAPDFQDEFCSKFDEFSESWRQQILKTQTKAIGGV